MFILKRKIEAIFVKPTTKEDLHNIINELNRNLQDAYNDLQLRKEEEASTIALATLEGIGSHYKEDKYNQLSSDEEIKECCINAAYIISEIMSRLSTRSDIKILTLFELQQIAEKDTFTKYQIIDMESFTTNKGVYQFKDNWKPSFCC